MCMCPETELRIDRERAVGVGLGMAPSKIRRALGAVKDQTSIGLAKVGSSNSLADLDVAIVKATRHEEYPAEERHVREIISLTSYSRAFITACVNTLARRLNKTKNWTVALKTLMLIHRLLLDGDPAYEQEIFFSTRRGTRILNMSDFRDTTSPSNSSWDFSAFVRTYALYLDERLEFRVQEKRLAKRSSASACGFEFDDDEEYDDQYDHHHPSNKPKHKTKPKHLPNTPVSEMSTDSIFSRINHLQQLLERFLACRPTGEAKTNRVVLVALYPIVKESFQSYYDMTEILGILIERFMELEVHECVKVHDIFYRISKQFDELDKFYHWCRNTGIARTSEYPEVEKIALKKLDLMDEFIRDKAALEQSKKSRSIRVEESPAVVEPTDPEEPLEEEDVNAVKALPAPEGWQEADPEQEEVKEEKDIINTEQQAVGDLLNLGEDAVTTEQHGDQLALALFDGGGGAAPIPAAADWEAFKIEDGADWETALIQSASGLPHQRTNLGGGLDMLLLDGMYQQGNMVQATMGGTFGASGSASSVAFGSVGRPAMLALPAPPTSNDGASKTIGGGDPFSASLAVAPPAYVQMSEMEKKQKLLMDEQLLWQQYARDGMHGHIGIPNFQGSQYPYNNGGYTHSY